MQGSAEWLCAHSIFQQHKSSLVPGQALRSLLTPRRPVEEKTLPLPNEELMTQMKTIMRRDEVGNNYPNSLFLLDLPFAERQQTWPLKQSSEMGHLSSTSSSATGSAV